MSGGVLPADRSAHAEMFPPSKHPCAPNARPLRTRGDVPRWDIRPGGECETAPHTRRCSRVPVGEMRKQYDRSAHAEMIRDQPARAEQVSPRFQHRSISSDQPRACGTGERWPRIKPAEPGSTPRVRDRFDLDGLSRVDLGINPARAGQVFARRPLRCHTWDQPRACGTGPWTAVAVVVMAGSTPRVRDR